MKALRICPGCREQRVFSVTWAGTCQSALFALHFASMLHRAQFTYRQVLASEGIEGFSCNNFPFIPSILACTPRSQLQDTTCM